MIDIKVRIHDKFSVELKTGFVVAEKDEVNDFAVNMWIFVPNSLDINPDTYSNEMFYRDIKSNVRLITPVFLLREMAGGKAVPYGNIEASFVNLASAPSAEQMAEYEYQIKMFMAIFKSSMRDESEHILSENGKDDMEYLCSQFIANVELISSKYRGLHRIINVPGIPEQAMNYYMMGDEFMSDTIERNTFHLLEGLDDSARPMLKRIASRLRELLLAEARYRRQRGFIVPCDANAEQNRQLIFRQGVLKKYIESDLFLQARRKKDGVAIEQLYLSLAAGISMIFATAVAFSVQQKFGNFTMPLFVALVVSYMLKDRIKDAMRYFFAHKLEARYFDNRTTVSMIGQSIGWIKEGMDFIGEDKVPPEVMAVRARTPLVQAENRVNDEKIMLFRKMVRLDSEMLREEDKYSVSGINDITRFHLNSFAQKMDDPQAPLYCLDDNEEIRTLYAEKTYYINFVIQLVHEQQREYKRFRLTMNRLGIIDIEELK